MTTLDHQTFVAMARGMASRNGYRAEQSSDLYITDGDQIDWLYSRHRIFSFTFELYPTKAQDATTDRFYPPDELIGRETRRNRDAVLYLLEMADCPYRAIGAADAWCGPFFDDLETARGWTVDPDGSDTATAGAWTRGDPVAGSYQRGDAISGRAVLVTGKGPGRDVDGGRTTLRSPTFALPETGPATLRLRWWLGHDALAGSADGLIIRLVNPSGETVFEALRVTGEGGPRTPAWERLDAPIPAALRGTRVTIELEARDGPKDGDATVEAAIDSPRVTAP